MNDSNKAGIKKVNDDGYEMNIYVIPSETKVMSDTELLKEIVSHAVDNGYSRFVGATGLDENLEPCFIFSKEDYFDKDDMLVSDYMVKLEINQLIQMVK